LVSDDAAKVFLQGFLDQLKVSDQTNRELLATNRELLATNREIARTQDGLFTQNNQIIRALSAVSVQLGTVSAQLDGIAQRTDYLYDQMGKLGRILMNDGSAQVLPAEHSYQPSHPTTIDTAARRLAREAMDGFVSSIFPGQQGGGRTRRR
jgi:hypothetical protein